MAGRGPQSFKKRQQEQKRKEKQQEKLAKKLERRQAQSSSPMTDAGTTPSAPGGSEHTESS